MVTDGESISEVPYHLEREDLISDKSLIPWISFSVNKTLSQKQWRKSSSITHGVVRKLKKIATGQVPDETFDESFEGRAKEELAKKCVMCDVWAVHAEILSLEEISTLLGAKDFSELR